MTWKEQVWCNRERIQMSMIRNWSPGHEITEEWDFTHDFSAVCDDRKREGLGCKGGGQIRMTELQEQMAMPVEWKMSFIRQCGTSKC